MIDQRRLDLLTSTVTTDRTIIRGGRARHVPFFTRLFIYTELRDWMLEAGFSSVSGRGRSSSDDQRNDLTIDSWRMIAIAQR